MSAWLLNLDDAAATNAVNPDGVNDTETIDATGPDLSAVVTQDYGGNAYGAGPYVGLPDAVITPDSTTDTTTTGGPALTSQQAAAPTGVADPGTPGAPDVDWQTVVETVYGTNEYGAGPYVGLPDTPITGISTINDAETIGTPSAATGSTATPASLTDTGTVGAPILAIGLGVTPASTADPDTAGAPTLGTAYTSAPSTVTDPDTVGAPALAAGGTVLPGGVNDLDTLGAPSASTVKNTAPDGVADPGTVGGAGIGATATTQPASTADPDTVGTPTAGFIPLSQNYGDNPYGLGNYLGNPTWNVSPDPVADAESIAAPTLANLALINENANYGAGTYGEGVYFGSHADADAPAVPLLTLIHHDLPPAQHILGIGPWSPNIHWRGAPNQGVKGGSRAAQPAMPLPTADSKSFTLRLDGGNEASASFTFQRGEAIVLQEMETDLWWRRRNPLTKTLEPIGRFNTAHLDMSSTDDGVAVNAQFQDYETVLAARMVMKYLDAPHGESMWAKNITPVTDILKFAIPTDLPLDLSALDTVDLGNIKAAFTLPPGTNMDDLFKNLLAISAKPWEWWVEMPADVTKNPALKFGTRGRNRGVVLSDDGGSGPIAAWSMNTSTSDYANVLYYQGGTGGFVISNPADVLRYGERDAMENNPDLGGVKDLIIAAGNKRLEDLGDRRPTYQLTLRQGYWRGRNHIDVGDTIGVHIRLGKDRVWSTDRVSELRVDIDDNNVETVTLTVGNPPPSTDPRSRRSALYRVVRALLAYRAPETSDAVGSPAVSFST